MDLTSENASEIKRLRNKGRRILHAMEGLEVRVEDDRERSQQRLSGLAGKEGEPRLPLEFERGMIAYFEYRNGSGPLGQQTWEWSTAVDGWCERNRVPCSKKIMPRPVVYSRRRGIGWDEELRWEVVPPSGRKTIYRLERWRDAIAAFRWAVESRVALLDDQLHLLGRGPKNASATSALRSWDLVRQTGSFNSAMFAGMIDTIETRSTQRQIRSSLAASKELVEGVMGGVLHDRGYTPKEIKGLKMLQLFDTCRTLLFADGDRAATDPDYATGRILSGAREMILGLTELRNAAGDGHARSSYVTGVTASHAAFVGDVAYALAALLAEQHLRVKR